MLYEKLRLIKKTKFCGGNFLRYCFSISSLLLYVWLYVLIMYSLLCFDIIIKIILWHCNKTKLLRVHLFQIEACESATSLTESFTSMSISSTTQTPLLGPGEIIKPSGKFNKPTRIPGKNYCKDEVVIRNADSGKGIYLFHYVTYILLMQV